MNDNIKLAPRLRILTTVLLGLIFHLTGLAQTNSNDLLIENPLLIVEPTFPGGLIEVYKIFRDSIQYPVSAKKERIGGQVNVSFIIDTLGMVKPFKILKGIRPDLDNEALRLVGLLNGWTPGTENGKKVKVYFNLSLLFFPDKKFEKEYKKNNSFNNKYILINGSRN